MIADVAGWVVIEILGWPLEWAIERICALLFVLSAVALLAYLAALAGAAYGVYWLVARVL